MLNEISGRAAFLRDIRTVTMIKEGYNYLNPKEIKIGLDE
jgi:hypothetical protein